MVGKIDLEPHVKKTKSKSKTKKQPEKKEQVIKEEKLQEPKISESEIKVPEQKSAEKTPGAEEPIQAEIPPEKPKEDIFKSKIEKLTGRSEEHTSELQSH